MSQEHLKEAVEFIKKFKVKAKKVDNFSIWNDETCPLLADILERVKPNELSIEQLVLFAQLPIRTIKNMKEMNLFHTNYGNSELLEIKSESMQCNFPEATAEGLIEFLNQWVRRERELDYLWLFGFNISLQSLLNVLPMRFIAFGSAYKDPYFAKFVDRQQRPNSPIKTAAYCILYHPADITRMALVRIYESWIMIRRFPSLTDLIFKFLNDLQAHFGYAFSITLR